MKLSELIQHAGDDNVEYQTINESFHSADLTSKGARITFNTHPHKVRQLASPPSEQDFIGLIVWIPRNRLTSKTMNDLTDTDPMPIGMHKGKPMSDVPVNYLHFLWQSGMKYDKSPVADYIRRNLDALKMENRDLIWR